MEQIKSCIQEGVCSGSSLDPWAWPVLCFQKARRGAGFMEFPLSCRPGELPLNQSLRRSLEALQLDFLELWVNAFLKRFIKSLLSARLHAWPCMGSFEINVPTPSAKEVHVLPHVPM